MAPGTFAQLHEQGDSSGLVWNGMMAGDARTGAPVGTVLAYCMKGVYSAKQNKVYCSTNPHYSTGFGGQSRLVYDVNAGLFSVTNNPVGGGVGHNYDSNAIDDARDFGYHNQRLEGGTAGVAFNRYPLITGGASTAMAQPMISQAEPSQEFFPERDELLRLQNSQLKKYNPVTDTWTAIRTFAFSDIGSRAGVLRYDRVNQCVIITGGANGDPPVFTTPCRVYKYDLGGTITQLQNAPPAIKLCQNSHVSMCDPASGDLIVIQNTCGAVWNNSGALGRTFWRYNVSTDQWAQMNATLIPDPLLWWDQDYPFAVIAAPISRYGVIFYLSGSNSGSSSKKSRAYLYKHSASTPPPPGLNLTLH